jgi:hypothetical protein
MTHTANGLSIFCLSNAEKNKLREIRKRRKKTKIKNIPVYFPKSDSLHGAKKEKPLRDKDPLRGGRASLAGAERSMTRSCKNTRNCTICMDKESDVVFLPCCHLCACERCSDAVHSCPVCRTNISRKIKIFAA